MGLIGRVLVSSIDRYQSRGGGLELFRVDCNFEPSCSEYARQAIVAHGTTRGLMLTLQRIRRCRDHDQVSRLHDPIPPKRG